MALRKGLNPSVWILNSTESIEYGHLLNAKCFEMTGEPKLKIWSPVHRDFVVNKFNDGLFHKILMHYDTYDPHRHWKFNDESILFLGAFAMDLGVKIDESDMEALRSALKRVEIDAEGRSSMEKALEHYKNNGERWDFRGIDLGATKQPEPGRSVPVEETEGEDGYLQNFLENHNAYMKAKEEKAAKGRQTRDPKEVDNGKDDKNR